jgi:hypothetical protein
MSTDTTFTNATGAPLADNESGHFLPEGQPEAQIHVVSRVRISATFA